MNVTWALTTLQETCREHATIRKAGQAHCLCAQVIFCACNFVQCIHSELKWNVQTNVFHSYQSDLIKRNGFCILFEQLYQRDHIPLGGILANMNNSNNSTFYGNISINLHN